MSGVEKIRVAVSGAAGRMGREVIKAVSLDDELQLVAAYDKNCVGKDTGELSGINKNKVLIEDEFQATLFRGPDVLVDFSIYDEKLMPRLKSALKSNCRIVVGTTGFEKKDIDEISALCSELKIGGIIAPNFSITAVLAMKLAVEASVYLPNIEIIELHHDGKLDAPSGTAIKTAEMIIEKRKQMGKSARVKQNEIIKIDGCRGGEIDGIRIHSVRLPGFVAHQEVIMGDKGQVLTIRCDSLSRESFMPGVIMSIKKVVKIDKLIYGIENLL